MARKKARQLFIPALAGAVLLFVRAADSPEDRLWRFRNLGAAELDKAQKQDPAIPHTWFNLGVVYKRRGDCQRAIEQFCHMMELVPTEGVAWYNLGVLYKLLRKTDTAVKYFETTERINPDLAAPHFQLYNAYRASGRAADASRELATFQQLKKKQEGSVTPEDMEWCYYSEIYETIEPRPAADAPGPEVGFTDQRLPGRADPATAGLAVLDAFASGRPDLLAWSGDGVRLYRSGAERRVYPAAARDEAGRVVLPRLLRRDRAYVDTFARDYNGVARLHSLELEFPGISVAHASACSGELQFAGLRAEARSSTLKRAPRLKRVGNGKVDGWAKDGDANTAFPWRAEYNTRPALRLLRRLAD